MEWMHGSLSSKTIALMYSSEIFLILIPHIQSHTKNVLLISKRLSNIKHQETIILWGNHELHYLLLNKIDEKYSRFDVEHAVEIQQLLLDNYSFFDGIAYSINDIYLVTHAGISRYWYLVQFGQYNGQSPTEIATKVNDLWEKDYHPFLIKENKQYDGTEEGPTQSPLWIRSYVLDRFNLFEGTPYKQIFGHTICRQIKEKDGLICIDCLRWMEHFEPGIATLFINN